MKYTDNDFNFKVFKSNMDSLIENADSLVSEIHEMNLRKDLAFDAGINDYIHPIEEERLESNQEYLSIRLNSIENRIIAVLDRLKLLETLEKFKADLKLEKYKENISYDNWIDIYYSPKLQIMKDYVDIILIDQEESVENSPLIILERILKGTPKIIFDRGIEPKNENDVQREVHKVLIHFFPDTLREFPIPKIAKTYKPDFGIKSLNCAVEYKFVDSIEEAKKFFGGIFEDVAAYGGYKDWSVFYAIIYMTEPFLTQYQVQAEFDLAKIPENWKPVVVYGPGKRIKK